MFVCQDCGYKSIKWLGKCPNCNSWETFTEIKQQKKGRFQDSFEKKQPMLLSQFKHKSQQRQPTGLSEFDRILGGGLVQGGVVLVGGEPGVGKSTLLLQVASALSKKNKLLYVSAEESFSQVALCAERLKKDFGKMYVLNEENVVDIYQSIVKDDFSLVVIDSIQAIYHPKIDMARGGINQIKACAEFLTRLAKHKNITILIVGHVTKGGAIAGPKLLEHIVDCVLYFEPEVTTNYRILRAKKNRFGSTGELAVFQMSARGLQEVKVLSDIFLPHKNKALAGSCVGCVIEGLKPLLLEFQALTAKASFGMVRRRSAGFDFNRFSLLVATIEKRLQISLANKDIFLNIAGGVRVTDPAADLAVISAIISSARDKPFLENTVFIGEVGLAGELRPVSHINLRLKEINKGGFSRCFLPKGNLSEINNKDYNFECIGLETAKEILTRGGKNG
jgi:DNA repair protein RadA/Sms